jgi:hypothetical protein
MGQFYNLDTFPQGLRGGGHDISKDIVIWPFNYAEQSDYLTILIGPFWEKTGVGGA